MYKLLLLKSSIFLVKHFAFSKDKIGKTLQAVTIETNYCCFVK